MPEYLAPGVYVEETSFRSKSIEGVATTTTGFVGPTRYGPHDSPPDILTSVADYERVHGDGEQLEFTGGVKTHNFMWHAVRAFFENGGKRLYVVRVLGSDAARASSALTASTTDVQKGDGTAKILSFSCPADPQVGSLTLTSGTKKATYVASSFTGDQLSLSAKLTGTTVEVTFPQAPPAAEEWTLTHSYPAPSRAHARFAGAAGNGTLEFRPRAGRHIPFTPGKLPEEPPLRPGEQPRPLKEGAIVEVLGKGWHAPQWRKLVKVGSDYSLERISTTKDAPDTTGKEKDDRVSLDADILRLAPARQVTVTFKRGSTIAGTWELAADPDALKAFFTRAPASAELARTLPVYVTEIDDVTIHGGDIVLAGGTDGSQPEDYGGEEDPVTDRKTGLKAFTDLEDISIVAAPGLAGLADVVKVAAGVAALQAHVEHMRFRVAVVDSMAGHSIGQVRQFRGRFDSTHMALYYPWVKVLDPITGREIDLPPSGFVTGIYARNDVNRAVYKAPANEVVRLAIDFERPINKAQQEVLNPDGINCLRFFEGRGLRVWGARTMSSDPEWKYINVRRYFAYLERSIDRGTQWAVFEPNGPLLWSNVRRTIEDFLLGEYQSGALLGGKPEQAYFVRCDRSTMTQNDLDNGRLVCLVGVAPLKPAEFVVFRVGQWTADAKS